MPKRKAGGGDARKRWKRKTADELAAQSNDPLPRISDSVRNAFANAGNTTVSVDPAKFEVFRRIHQSLYENDRKLRSEQKTNTQPIAKHPYFVLQFGQTLKCIPFTSDMKVCRVGIRLHFGTEQ